ncbi:hypothetical protein VTO42DRAFT_7261 [Malbranchea cinnamomea]
MASSPSAGRGDPHVHPIIRNALRISLTESEYRLLHKHLIERLPPSIQKRTYSPLEFETAVRSPDRYNEAAIRASLRVFLATAGGMKLVEVIAKRINARKASSRSAAPVPYLRSPGFRLALTLSSMLLLHRILYRFFTRLRINLKSDDARPFRDRNPRISMALTSKYAPAIGASFAGFMLAAYPKSQLRVTVAIYAATRSLEFLYNSLDERGWFKNRPWWFGSWLLMPLSTAQLFHAFIFDRDTAPKWFGDFILRFTPDYISRRPVAFPPNKHWPDPYETVDSLAKIAELKWPAFTSPILHPGNPCTLPAAVRSVSPITSPAHPAVSLLSCAILHPKTPSCLTAFFHQNLLAIPLIARFLTKIYLVLSLLFIKSFLSHPIATTNALCRKILSMTAVLSAAIGSAWGSVCLFSAFLPRSFLPTQRFFLSGALAGLPFALLGGGEHRSHFLYFFRLAIDSAWKVGVKRKLWRGYKGGEVVVFVASWALIGALLQRTPTAITDPGMRKGLAWVRGDGFVDPVERRSKKKNKKSAGRSG